MNVNVEFVNMWVSSHGTFSLSKLPLQHRNFFIHKVSTEHWRSIVLTANVQNTWICFTESNLHAQRTSPFNIISSLWNSYTWIWMFLYYTQACHKNLCTRPSDLDASIQKAQRGFSLRRCMFLQLRTISTYIMSTILWSQRLQLCKSRGRWLNTLLAQH